MQVLSDSGEEQTGGRVASVWCSYRFALHHFFSGSPRDDKAAAHRRKKKIAIWISVSVAVLVGVAIVTAIALYCRKKKRLSRNNLPSGEEGREAELEDMAREEAAQGIDSGQFEPCPSALDGFGEIIRQANMKEIIVFLDYDGTLSPILTEPDKAYMSDEMREVPKDVAVLFKTSIVSGRARGKVFDFVRIKEINYAGSHGKDIKLASTTESTSTSEIVFDTLLHATEDIKGAKIEHNIFCVSLHYRNCSEKDMPRVQRVVENILEELKDAVKLTKGKRYFFLSNNSKFCKAIAIRDITTKKYIYEFRAPIVWNKGHAVQYIQRELGLEDPFSIYIGDDQTDEDAFEILRETKNGIGILVSEASKKTRAFFSLRDPSQVMEFLKMLVSWKRNQ
ncbi:hypothetical protein C2845_PM05G06800 [Panicum miliaceum]|uniref:Trehalose 6-phosphate phosphatase n=1 Tax=Panicum miliaceum TaxID=4540 RepID=A0A3L6SVB4_PANMI|nr:hypothetical protein C2845_PM05G06800 [Panicum miliaceum]